MADPVIDKTMATRIATQLGWRPKKKWKGLTAKERSELWWNTDMGGMPEHDYGKKVEALLKEKNSGI